MFMRVIVLGAGQMGSGIAQVTAQKNLPVLLLDPSEKALQKARTNIKHSLQKLHQKNLISLNPDKALQNIYFVTDFSQAEKLPNGPANAPGSALFSPNELIIEAVPEDTTLKLQVFKQISRHAHPQTIIASNTSSIPIDRLASAVQRPERVAGLHFMNPVPLMKLVEIIRGQKTAPEVFTKLNKFTLFLGKEAVLSQDRPGFIVNRVLMPMINTAVFALQEGLADAKDIDKAMRLGCHHPMGPLALADLIGLDTCLSIMEVLQKGLGQKYSPCPLLKRYVAEGRLGKKNGKGFYNY